ncbi:MAG: DUF2268 domain-containing putative Zn-dependent protease [Bdellovibrionales bacterium]
MIRVLLLSAIGIAFSFSAFAGPPRIHNHAPEFVKFWDKVKDLPLTQQIQEFERMIYPTFPEFYAYRFKRWQEQGKTKEEGLKKAFDDYRAMHTQFAQKTASISNEIHENLVIFLKHFPDFTTDFDIHIIPSLGEMDGGTRTIDGNFYFIFGIDGILKYHNASTDVPFFHHELFHMYHWQFFKGEEKMWYALWAEGLATYVSEALNPGSSLRDIMLDIPEGLVKACEEDMAYLWFDFQSVLDTSDEAAYERYFLLSSKDPRVPRRAGYYLGYIVAKELAQKYTLDELTKMDAADLRKRIGKVIDAKIGESTSAPFESLQRAI